MDRRLLAALFILLSLQAAKDIEIFWLRAVLVLFNAALALTLISNEVLWAVAERRCMGQTLFDAECWYGRSPWGAVYALALQRRQNKNWHGAE